MGLKEELFPTFGDYKRYWEENIPIWDVLIYLRDIIQNISDINLIDASAKIHPNAIITNSIIGKNVEIYEGVTIRDSIILDNTVIGHCSEVARSVLLKGCFVPRFNYIGGSFLGESVRLGGHTTLATKRHDDRLIKLRWGNKIIETKKWKFGSIIGDHSIMAYAVHVNPGSVVGSNTIIYPYVDVNGFIPSNSMVTVQQKIKRINRRELPDIELIFGE